MNTYFVQQEILLMTNTSFSSRACSKIKDTEKDYKLSLKEQLMEACWNGLAREMLPECFENFYDKLITILGINDANNFIDLQFGEFMQRQENAYSVNPYAFMQVQVFN